jgi:hypothetical protein
MRSQRVCAALLAPFLLGASCPPAPHPQPPGPTPVLLQDLIASECPELAKDPLRLVQVIGLCNVSDRQAALDCVRHVCHGRTPTPSPSPSPTPVPTLGTPTEQPTNPPTGPTRYATVPSVDYSPAERPAQYARQVRESIASFQARHPELFDGAKFKICAEGWACPISQDVFLWGVAAELTAHGLDGIPDPNGPGDLVVADSATPLGQGFAEGYHPIDSARVIHPGKYLGRSEPRWIVVEGNSSPTPETKTPTPTPNPSATSTATATSAAACPPLLEIDVYPLLQDGVPVTYPAQGGGLCRVYNLTPRFLVNGKNEACNAVKWENCGPAGGGKGSGDLCEPAFEHVTAVFTSASGPSWPTKDYGGRVCGPIGSRFEIVVDLKPGAVDKAGRPIDRSRFSVFKLPGAI